MIVDRITPATSAWRKPGGTSPDCGGVVEDGFKEGDERDKGPGSLGLVRGEQLVAELGHDGRGVVLRRPSLRRRKAHAVVLDHEAVEALERRALLVQLFLQPVRCRQDRLVEKGEKQLVLAGEVLIEAPEGLPRAVHHFLNGELLARLGPGQQLETGVEEALDPPLAPQPGRVQGSSDGQITAPDRLGSGWPCRRIVNRHRVSITADCSI